MIDRIGDAIWLRPDGVTDALKSGVEPWRGGSSEAMRISGGRQVRGNGCRLCEDLGQHMLELSAKIWGVKG